MNEKKKSRKIGNKKKILGHRDINGHRGGSAIQRRCEDKPANRMCGSAIHRRPSPEESDLPRFDLDKPSKFSAWKKRITKKFPHLDIRSKRLRDLGSRRSSQSMADLRSHINPTNNAPVVKKEPIKQLPVRKTRQFTLDLEQLRTKQKEDMEHSSEDLVLLRTLSSLRLDEIDENGDDEELASLYETSDDMLRVSQSMPTFRCPAPNPLLMPFGAEFDVGSDSSDFDFSLDFELDAGTSLSTPRAEQGSLTPPSAEGTKPDLTNSSTVVCSRYSAFTSVSGLFKRVKKSPRHKQSH
eukprot:TRINITY_DN6648_c0_g1_i1.p1 TRINITY_DN6648_c0_g1~~TRINITY_DN6648_c0_g1_i1.p1  ORF type:complete len:296 (+),score=40.33 TRINITY_DN6648_c0_g1_i1:207-1094(+)